MNIRIIIGLQCFLFLSCSTIQDKTIEYKKALISCQELMKYEDKNFQPISLVDTAVNLNILRTYSNVDMFVKKICSGQFSNIRYDDCIDELPFIFNLKDFTFNPNSDNRFNAKIPAFEFQCGQCIVEPLSSYSSYIYLTIDSVYRTRNCLNDNIIEYKDTVGLSENIDTFYKSYFTHFFNKTELIKKYLSMNRCSDYYVLSCPNYTRISIDTSMNFTRIEPLISIIIRSYYKNLNDYTEKYLNKPIGKLSILELKLLGHNVPLNIRIVRPWIWERQ